jgi:rod shape-determining protein MreC
MFKRPHYIVLNVLGLVALIVIAMPRQASSQVKLAISSLFLPLFGLAGAGSKAADKASEAILPRGVLEAQLAALKKENEALKFDLVQHTQIVDENDRLRAALGWQKRSKWTLKLARVTARDPANWWRTVQINAGKNDGIAPDMPVLTSQGLVGRVDEVGANSSRITLLGDPNCRVAALVVETKDSGVIAPGSSTILDPSVAVLTYLSRHSKAQPGNWVRTSEKSGIFPAGILIGQVADVESVGQGLYMEARVKLAADLERLDLVWVIIGGGR